MIVSPWAKIGWSYQGEKEFSFDATVGSYPHSFMSAPDIAQQMRRPRFTTRHYGWTKRPDAKTRPDKKSEKLDASFQTLPSVQRLKQQAEVASELLGEPEVERKATFVMNSLFNTQMSEQARHVQLRHQLNIPYHLQIILSERECVVHKLSNTGIKTEGLEDLLTIYGEQEHLEEMSRIYKDSLSRETVVNKYYRMAGGVKEKADSNTCDFEQFVELYERALEIKEDEIEVVARIWNALPQERQAIDLINTNQTAELAGRLLDEVDRIVCRYIGDNSRFLDWLADDSQEDLYALITNEDWSNLKACIADHGMRINERVSWARSLGSNHLSFIEEMAKAFDLDFQVIKKTGSKLDAKHEAIRNGVRIKIIKPWKAKKTPAIGEKIKKVEEEIDRKLRSSKRLSQAEEAYQSHRGDFLQISKRPLRSVRLRDVLETTQRL